ncbi:cyclic nucleotide-gated ion channel 1-like [Argentina anserina]|uniref:cyclic nucleotide-gated ion channel 1-like n=1 Tax=Argentina anserina TaxID=57926 RepID=UPI00217684AC|nr:cyclic nucleotide-gated ion channel 1-like [Potentilla anserina]
MQHNNSNDGPNETRLSIRDWNHLDVEGKAKKIQQANLISGGKYRPRDAIFVLSCVVGFFIDPFFFYIWIIDDNKKCIFEESKLRISFLVSRSVVDFFYVAAIMRNCGTRSSGYTSRRIKLLRFLLAFNLAFPYPQLAVLADDPTGPTLLLFYSQYMSRISQIYEWVKHINIETRYGRWVKGVSDLCPFFLTAHLVGAMWYFFAIHKETSCWLKACRNNAPYAPGLTYVYCRGRETLSKRNCTDVINKSCPTNPSVSHFGMYLDLIKFNTTRTTNCGSKLLQCFTWGLRNLSSLGSNLEASSDTEQNVFIIFISISGIILYLIYINEQMQTYRQLAKKLSKKLKFNRKIQQISPDVDLWLYKNADIPKKMKTVIMDTVRYRVEEDKDFHVEDIISILNPVHRRFIMRPLCLDILKTVPLLEHMDAQVLTAISEHINWVFYAVDSYIIREGEPLRKMFFIRQGTALTYTTCIDRSHQYRASGGSTSGSSITNNLEKDDLYGAELLEWAFSFGSFTNLPASTRTVVPQERVEAFVIRAKDLKKIVSMFWWQFSRNLQLNDIEDSLLRQLKFMAISSLLRQRKAMANRGTGWDQVYNKLIKSD